MAGAQSARSTRWPRPLWRSACRLAPHVAITLVASVCFAERTVAQSTPSVTIAATLEADAPSETALEITVGPAAALPRGSIVRLYGLPPLAALSAGHSIAPGAWAIPVVALPNLKVMLPGAVSGKSQIKVTIVSSDGAILAEARSTLIVLPKVTPPPVAAPSVGSQTLPAGARSQPAAQAVPAQTPPPPVNTMSAAERDHAMRLVKRGDEQLADGGIAQARLFYERAAEAGLAQGAMALASTYDPAELGRLGVVGIQPDRAVAARWYERARLLGATEAAQRLQRLGAR